jgi:glycosyltransferase involved in cell wall biosynthesis
MARRNVRLKVFIDTPSFFIRPNNTDWRYMRRLGRLAEFVPVSVIYPRDWAGSLLASAQYATNAVMWRLMRSKSRPLAVGDYQHKLSVGELRASGADVVLSHGPFPVNTEPVPSIWQHCVLDPQMLEAAGKTRRDIEAEYLAQQPCFAAAAAVQVATKREAKRHAVRFPALADRFMAVPFFKPDLKAIPAGDVAGKHRKDGPIDILFVGREARRKGLDILVSAIGSLPAAEKCRLHLHVVSQMSDGKICFPQDLNITRYEGLPFEKVLQLMALCQIFAMPSRFESFGLTFVEAMSQGCAVIGPAWECQKEILADGNAGINAGKDAESVAAAITELLDPSYRLKLAEAAHQRFHEVYCGDVVARAYLRLFETAVARS